jgi:hypothetical protein
MVRDTWYLRERVSRKLFFSTDSTDVLPKKYIGTISAP